MNSEVFDKSRRFYHNKVAPMITEKFPQYESRIAVGLSGEGSDCFGYDDLHVDELLGLALRKR